MSTIENTNTAEVQNESGALVNRPNSELTVEDMVYFADKTADTVGEACRTISGITCTISDTVKHIHNVKLEIKRLDTQLEAFIVQSQNNLERFKAAIPVLQQQLNNISSRIDRITDSILNNTTDQELTEDAVKKHHLLLDLLASTNDSFNNMLMRVIAL